MPLLLLLDFGSIILTVDSRKAKYESVVSYARLNAKLSVGGGAEVLFLSEDDDVNNDERVG